MKRFHRRAYIGYSALAPLEPIFLSDPDRKKVAR